MATLGEWFKSRINDPGFKHAIHGHDWTYWEYVSGTGCEKIKRCRYEKCGQVEYGIHVDSGQICDRCGEQLDGFMNC